ncbi:GNAT family N-acetyltransferase [Streptomyces sp. V3I7]|uniref:GNAT family N-acetyltransferase n=1 Tax=Streptomyces sp. V3I7 TaxID=3042278 RepID=UPI002789E5D6|nr:GNAT family N-acetyltransferase [Streptomyces sp. V3I7]MDQ0989852.1 GNAT superfamily N-acetyltransferase [Streptomyces sp. V3I7]
MTTTLRPTEPLQHAADGALSRHFQVCVNSRPVGEVRVSTHPLFGPPVARIEDLSIEEPDRGRGRGTVAALAAEEVARGWGCERVEITVPAESGPALRLATALGYVRRNRGMEKALGEVPPGLPAGSRDRPMTEAEYGTWREQAVTDYAQSWIDRGVPEDEAQAKAERDYTGLLPRGLATANMRLSVLEHEDTSVGILWLFLAEDRAFVYKVETDEAYRGRGHGRSLMLLAEAQAAAAGKHRIGLNVFAGNTPAERLYESLGYEPVSYGMYKNLI